MTDWTSEGLACRTLVAVLAALLLAILLGWLANLHPLLEAITNVRAQTLPIALALVAGFVILKRWNFALVAVGALVILLVTIVPYWTGSLDPLPADGETVTVMQYNVFFGNDDFVGIVEHIEASDADVVALHELLPSQWLGLEPLLDAYPHRITAPLAETEGQPGGGMALLSRTPLNRVDLGVAISPAERVTLAATTVIDGTEIQLVGLHPHASRTESAKVTLRHAQVDGVAELARSTELPMIVLTDLNATPTSSLYQNFLDDAGWHDPHRRVGWQSTWPTWGGPFGIPIDHVLVSDDFLIHRYSTGDGAGSDHKSLVAEVSLRR